MHEALLRSLIQHWGFAADTELLLQHVIESDEVSGHAPKYVFSVGPARRLLFLGNSGRSWPSTQRVEACLSALERSALAHPFGTGPAVLVPAVRSLSGSMIVVHEEVRYYLTSHVPGCTLANALASMGLAPALRESCMLLLSAAAGAFHCMSRAAGNGCQPMDDAASFWFNSPKRCCKDLSDLAANRYDMCHWAGRWCAAHSDLARRAHHALTSIMDDSSKVLCRLQALPAIWTHGDLQMKNVMLGAGTSPLLACAAAGGSLHVRAMPPGCLAAIDVTHGAYSSRLYDLYFLLAGGSDDAAVVFQPCAVQNRFTAYFDAGGLHFSEEELSLLVEACVIKGLSVAQYYALWSSHSQAPALFEHAARSCLCITAAKDEVRAAIVAAQAGGGEAQLR